MNDWVTLFAEPWIERLGWVLIHFLWQGTGIALLLAVALRVASRASSHVRYVMIGSAFLLCAALPVATWIILGPQASSSIASATVLTPMAVPHVESTVLRGSAPLTNGTMESPGNVQTRWRDNLSQVADVLLPYVVGLWFVGVLILTLRLTMGWMLMRRVCLSGLPIHDAFCLERFQVLLERMQVGVPVRLVQSALVEVPTLIGWLRPTILVPASVFTGLAPDQLDAILAHELAHIRRYDYLLNLLQTLIETILFYHPAVWWISRKLREERENCCDDIALEVMQDRLVYVSALAQLEQGRGLPLALTASGGSLLHRIRRIVGANDQKVSAWPLWILFAAILSTVCLEHSKASETQVMATARTKSMSDAEAKEKGIAALVNQKPIFWSDVASDPLSSASYLKAKQSGNDLLLKFALQEAIDSELVMQDAEASGYRVPQSDLDQRMDFGVKGFGGNKDVFAENLKKNGSSLEQFTEQNRRSETYQHMFILRVDTPTKVYLHDHPMSPSGASPDEIKKAEDALYQTKSIRLENDWMQSLRAKAVIQTFEETTPLRSETSTQPPGPTAEEIKAEEDSQTPLMKALQSRQYDQARALLAQGADCNVTDKMGSDALAFLIGYSGNAGRFPIDILQTLLARTRDPNPPFSIGFSNPPQSDPLLEVAFMSAAYSNGPDLLADNRQVVKLLIAHGARFAGASDDVQALLQAAALDDLPNLQQLVTKGTSPSAADGDGWTPLLVSIALGNNDTANWLIDHGANVSAITRRGADDPLLYATAHGDDAIVEKLIAKGAKPVLRGGDLWRAIDRNDQRLFDDLINAGADPKQEGEIHGSAGGKSWRQIDNDSLFVCIAKGRTAMALTLIDKGVDPEPANVQSNRNYAYWAVHFERPEILKALLDHGANPLLKNAQGETPLSLAQKSHPKLVPMLQAAISQHQTKSETSIERNSALTKALIAAAQQGNVAQVSQLLKQGADPKANLNPDQKNALFVAAENNQVEVLKLLLKNGADPNCANSCGNAPIDWTLSRGNLEAATVLHDAGAKISPEGWAAATGDLVTLRALASSGVLKKGKTDGAMDYATSMGQFEAVKFLESIEGKPVAGKFLAQAARSGNIPMLDYILSRGANIKTDGGDAMDQAIIFFNQPESVKWLLAHGVDPNHFSKWNEFSLAECKSAALVKILLDAGANPNGQGDGNDDMDAPLVHAPDAESVRLLVQHGANLKPKFKDGYTLIDIVTSRNSDDKAEVIAELIKQGAEFDPKGNGATALARAAAWNHLDTMQVLLGHGVSPSAYSDEPFMHCSALNNAANEPSPEAVKFLLDHGADPNGDPRDTNTPLGYAVMCGREENAELLRKAGAHDVGDLSIAAAQGDIGKVSDLLNSGANINETDHAGNTPLYYSVRRGHPDVARLLIQNGANVNPFNLWGQTAQGDFEMELAIQGPNRSELDWGVPEDEGNRRRAIFKELFAKYPVNPSYQDSHGRTALHQSAFAGNSELDPLRDNPHPACLNLLDNDGNTPLILAALSPQASELVTKISVSDPKHPDKSVKDWNGAAYIADRLIQAGAKLDLKMPNGQTQGQVAMTAAVKAKNPQLISVLHDAGIASNIPAPKPADATNSISNPADAQTTVTADK